MIFFLNSLICFSFILTENTSKLMKDNDEIMVNIKEFRKGAEILSINAVIKDNEIIPGINGRIVDLEQSYQVMKKFGINNNYNKYVVSGNKNKNMVSLIFKIHNDANIDSIVNLFETKKIDTNLFVIDTLNKKNIEILKKLNFPDKYYCYIEHKNETLLEECSSDKVHTIIPNLVINKNLLSNVKKEISNGSIIFYLVLEK